MGVKKRLITNAENGSCSCFLAADATELQPIRYPIESMPTTNHNRKSEGFIKSFRKGNK